MLYLYLMFARLTATTVSTAEVMAHSFALQAKLTTLIPGKGEQV